VQKLLALNQHVYTGVIHIFVNTLYYLLINCDLFFLEGADDTATGHFIFMGNYLSRCLYVWQIVTFDFHILITY
jgi:hypothetical protein